MIGIYITIYLLGFVFTLDGIRNFNKKCPDFFKIDLEYALYRAILSWLYLVYIGLVEAWRFLYSSKLALKINNFFFDVFIDTDTYDKLNRKFRDE